jgi:hypothetical protein
LTTVIAERQLSKRKKRKESPKRESEKNAKKNNVTTPVKSTVKANPARFYTATSKTTDTFEDLVQVLGSQ